MKIALRKCLIFVTVILIQGDIVLSANDKMDPPFIQELVINNDAPDKTSKSRRPPNILISDNILLYEDGELGPIQAYDLKSLSLKWKNEIPYDYEAKLCDITDSLAFIYIDGVFGKVGLASGKMTGINIYNGKEIWSTSAPSPFKRRYKKVLLIENLLIYCGSENLTVIELNTGYLRLVIRYSFRHSKIIDTKTFLEGIQPDSQDTCSILWAIDDRIYSINPITGEVYKEFYPGNNIRPVPMPDVYSGLGHVIDHNDYSTVCYNYEVRKQKSQVFCVDVTDWQVLWKHEDYNIDMVQVVNDGALILKGREIIKKDALDGNEQWKTRLDKGDIIIGYEISDGIIYICDKWIEDGNRSGLYALNINTGDILWHEYFTGSIQRKPVFYNNKIYIILQPGGDYDHNGVIKIYDHKQTVSAINNIK